jgi:L-amino acid N-acyltransferase YncA
MPAVAAVEMVEPVGEVAIAPMTAADGDAVLAIYAEGIAGGDATLETRVPDWSEFDGAHRPDGRLVARLDGRVVGWAAMSAYSSRAVYAGVSWESVYVTAEARGRGIGRQLLEALIGASETAGTWTLLAGVLAENTTSLALHERCGFRRLGVQERVGRDGSGRWRDVVLLERRSATVGTEDRP